jgi:hypothetical protein
MSLSKSDQSWEGISLSKDKWREFSKSDIWKAILFELDERDKYLLQLFKDSDKEWPPDVIKGKMTELDFFRQIPALILLSINDKENREKEIRDGNEDG